MTAWEVGDDGLRVVDDDNRELSIPGTFDDVSPVDTDMQFPVDVVLEATTSKMRFPHEVIYVNSFESGDWMALELSERSLTVGEGVHEVDVDAAIKTYVRAEGPFRIERAPDFGSVVMTLESRQPIHLGFRSRHEYPEGSIAVPFTPGGLAEAIPYLASAIKTDDANRSFPTLRGHPPLIEEGETVSIPDHIASRRPSTGIEFEIPERFESVYVVSPLAYYLQANVRTSSTDRPILRLTDPEREFPLRPMPAFERDVERLLKRCFFLDSLVRNVGPHSINLDEFRMLDLLELDPHSLYHESAQSRLDTYLDVPFDAISHRVPTWHLAMYVEPSPDNVGMVPFLLDRLSLCYMPRTSELRGKELIERSLDDFYRSAAFTDHVHDTFVDRTAGNYRSMDDIPSVEIVKPDLRTAKIHGWIADGVPIDVFKSTQAAYRNRLEHLDEPSDSKSICVVLNEPEMASEHDDATGIYLERSRDIEINVRIETDCRVDELAEIFESSTDFVHFIGHCERSGLRCPDGHLSASNLSMCGVQTVFLNACGSFYEGSALIERGSVAGAVTFAQVLNDHAVKVGTTFAKLLVHGFSIERAMQLARRRIMMGKDYAVVGDGTHTIAQGDDQNPPTVHLEPTADDRYLLTIDSYSTEEIGGVYAPFVGDNEYLKLCGNESSFIVDDDGLASFLAESEHPVIYDGDLYWTGELLSKMYDS